MRCKKCCMPSTRPDHTFIDGVCPACINHEKRPEIDWEARRKDLERLLDRFHGDVIVPSSGGKDSTYQAITLKEMEANVTAVTARTCHLTDIGRANIDNLAKYVRTIEYTPNMTVRAKLNRLGLELVGDISWPEHAAIFSTPFRASQDLGIPLIMYGENPQNQYGGPQGSEEAKTMTQRWTQEFGGFLGLRPSDFVGMNGITSMEDYELPKTINSEAHFLGQYLPWDSHRNAEIAREYGMIQILPCQANWWGFENLDNLDTFWHDFAMYRKYGYGRAATQLAVDVRNERVTRDFAIEYIKKYDGQFCDIYAGHRTTESLERIGLTLDEMFSILDGFTNWDLFDGVENNRPILKEFTC